MTAVRRIVREDIHSTEHRDAARVRAFKHKDLTRREPTAATVKRSFVRKASAVACSKTRRSVDRISRVMRATAKTVRVATTDKAAIARVTIITVARKREDTNLAVSREAIKTVSKAAIARVTTTTEALREVIARVTATM